MVKERDQVIEDISLVDMDRDERLKADSVDLAEVARRLRDEHIEDVKKLLIRRLHDLLVIHTVRQSLLRVSGPYKLQCQQAHLQQRFVTK